MSKLAGGAFLLCLAARGLWAQEEAAPVLVFRGARVITVSGRTLRSGVVVVREGKIEAVGEAVSVPEGAEVVDLTGKVLMPGLVAVRALGLGSRGGMRRGTSRATCFCAGAEGREAAFGLAAHVAASAALPWLAGFPALRPEELLHPEWYPVAPADDLDPYDRDILFALSAGITTVWSPPDVVLKLAYGRREEMVLSENRFEQWQEGSFVGKAWHELRRGAEEARRYRLALADYERAKREYERAKARYEGARKAGKKLPPPVPLKRPRKPQRFERWERLFAGKRWARVQAASAPALRRAAGLAARYGFSLVLEGATEAWAVAAAVARARAAVILNPRAHRAPTPATVARGWPVFRFGSRVDTPARLYRHGVAVALLPPQPTISFRGIGGRDLLTFLLDAAFAVRAGLPRAEALRAVTLTPARILGVADRVGSIEPGKDADLVVLDGDPFAPTTLVERVYVNGRLVYDREEAGLFDYLAHGRIVKRLPTSP